MGNELLKVSPSVDVELSYPDSLSQQVVSAVGIATVSVARVLLQVGVEIAGAVVQKVEETSVRISFYHERGQYLREYVIPTLAIYEAVQAGRNFIESARWDADLKVKAMEDINRKLERYRTR